MLSMDTRVAVIGGTGDLGGALARRFARAGLHVLIGSRRPEAAGAAADALAQSIGMDVGSGSNQDVAARADIVIVAVPYAAHEATLTSIRDVAKGKLVVDATVPLVPPKVMRVQLPAEGAAAVRARNILGDEVALVSAFHTVSAEKLARDEDIDCDVLIFGDDKAARATVASLTALAGLRGIQGGPLPNAAAAEALTSVLIFVNKHYSVSGGAGIRLTGNLHFPKD